LPIDEILQHTFVAGVEHYATLGSTNDLAKHHAAAGRHRLPLLIVADEQTAGRGRGVNRWWTGRGGLAFSLLLDAASLGVSRRRSPLLALAAAIAVVDAAAPRLPSHQVGLHWPNDVYVDGRKLSGVLVEYLADGHVVIGVGINTNNTMTDAPHELKRTATTLFDLTGIEHNHTELLVAAIAGLETLLERLVDHPELIGRRADTLCLQRGLALSVDLGDQTIRGRCAGIGEDGALLLDTANGRQKVFSGVLD